jgi:hypothetical protein
MQRLAAVEWIFFQVESINEEVNSAVEKVKQLLKEYGALERALLR